MSSSDPPADLDAERKLLGAVLLQPSMLDELLGEVSPGDFFYAGNGAIYGAMVDLAIEDKPVSVGTVARALDSQLLRDLGGTAGITALIEGALPSEAPYYAEIIVNKRKKRNLLIAADKARGLALSNSDPNKDYNEISELLSIGLDGRGSETIAMSQGADIFLERFARLISNPGTLSGPSTGFDKLDQLLDGLRPGGVTTVYARTNDYKALALDTPIPTPLGWTTMGEIKPGDLVFNELGNPTKVVGVGNIAVPPRAYAVSFKDGEVIEASCDHGWPTCSAIERKYGLPASVKTTEEIANSLKGRDGKRNNHSIQLAEPIGGPDIPLPIDPYLLGVWLGDGTTSDGSITSGDPEIIQAFIDSNFKIGMSTEKGNCTTFRPLGFMTLLRDAGVLKNKHIPEVYFRASEPQRLALMHGLMDTDGSVDSNGRCVFGVTNERLARDTLALAVTLGHKPNLIERRTVLDGRDCGPAWYMSFVGREIMFRLERKAKKQNVDSRKRRYISDCIPIEPKPMRCITVDGPSHLYLAGKGMVPTHNSMFVANIGYSLATDGSNGLWYTTESPNYEVMERLAQFESQLNIRQLKFDGALYKYEDQIRNAIEVVRGYPIWINTKSSLDLGFVSATTRQLNRQYPLDYIIVDLVDKVGSKKFETDTRNSAHVMEQMKQLAKQEDLHVLLTTHVRKGDKFADWSKPYIDLDEMKDTSAKGQDSDAAISLVPVKPSTNTWGWEAMKWEERVEAERSGRLALYVSVQKNRHGPRGHLVLEIDLTRGGLMDMMVTERQPTEKEIESKWPSK